MNKNIIIAAIVFALAGCGGSSNDTSDTSDTISILESSANASDDLQDMYLIIGQSNAAGRDIDGIDLDGLDATTSKVQIYTNNEIDDDSSNDNKDDKFTKATQPLNQYSGIRKSAEQGVNLGLQFGRDMYAYNGRTVHLVVNARGGSTVVQWADTDPDTDYDRLLNSIERTKEALTSCNCALRGIIWHQGEGDIKSYAGADGDYYNNAYYASLTKVIEALRDEFGSKVPFIVGQLYRGLPNAEQFNEDIKDVDITTDRFDVERVNWVSSKDLDVFDEYTHFSAESTRELGSRYAEKMKYYVD